MVTYGPWIEPPIIEAVTPFGHDSGDGDMLTHYNVEDIADPARLRPGLRLTGGGEKAMDNAFDTVPAAASPDMLISKAVWEGMLESNEILGGIPRDVDGANQSFAFVDYTGEHGWSPAVGGYRQHDYWGYNVGNYRMSQEPQTPMFWPKEEEWPAGAYWVEVEATTPPQLLSARISPLRYAEEPYGLGPDDAPWWSMYIKPPQATSTSLAEDEMTLQQVFEWQEITETGYEFDAENLAILQSMLRKAGEDAIPESDRHWTEIAIAYTGPWPGNLPWLAPWPPNTATYRCKPELALYLTYRVPRYRFLYDVTPRIPRRIFPRDDGMTGGARRVWPPSKSHQWGNRVDGSGYL